MLREEAESEAARRNREDPDCDRFEFYAFDESAGMAPDAWEVAARLRRVPSAPEVPAAVAAQAPPAEPHEAAAEYEQAYAAEAYEAFPAEPLEPRPRPRRPALPRRARAVGDDGRPGRFVRTVGVAVIATGVVWIGLVVALAAILTPEDAVAFAVYFGLGLLGVAAIGLGLAIRRS